MQRQGFDARLGLPGSRTTRDLLGEVPVKDKGDTEQGKVGDSSDMVQV